MRARTYAFSFCTILDLHFSEIFSQQEKLNRSQVSLLKSPSISKAQQSLHEPLTLLQALFKQLILHSREQVVQ